MVGKIKTRNKKESRDLLYELHRNISDFYSDKPLDYSYVSGVEIGWWKGKKKSLYIVEEVLPKKYEELEYFIDMIEQITGVPWSSWAYYPPGRYYYIYLEEENCKVIKWR